MPLPLNDITNVSKERPSQQFTDLIRNIQELLFSNCAHIESVEPVVEPEPEKPKVDSEKDKKSRPVRTPSNTQVATAKPSGNTVSISSHKVQSSKAKSRTLRHTKQSEQLELDMEEGEKKKHLKVKPSGIDTMTATNMFGQLNDYLKKEGTSEETQDTTK